MKKFNLLMAIAVLILGSCKKEHVDVVGPVITIAEPSQHTYMIDTTTSSVTVPFEFTATDDGELHEVHISIQNTTDNVETFHVHVHPHTTTMSFDTTLVFTSSHKDYTFSVTAEDHSQNSSTETHDFHVHKM